MSKTNIVLLVVIFVVLLAGGVGLYLVMSPKTPTLPQAADLRNTTLNKLAQNETSPVADKTYEDAAGFSFKYPAQFSVQDVTPSDNNYYSKLKLTGKSGEITLTAVDTTYKTLSEWQNVNKDAVLTSSSSLSDVKANQYKRGKTLLTVAIDQGVLYTIENISDSGSLDASHAIISSTFRFSNQPAVNNTSTSSSGDAEYEAEEVVE